MWTEAGGEGDDDAAVWWGEGVSFGGRGGPQSGRGIVCMTPHIIFD